MREREIEQYLVSEIRTLGFECLKFIPDGRTGMPDRIVLLPDSKVLWVELKTKGGKLSAIQRYRHEELAKLGQRAAVVWSKEQVDDLIQELREKEKSRCS